MATGQSSRQRSSGADAPEEGAIDPTLPQKKRARHRLIGAIALSLVAAVVLPLVFESEPPKPPADVAIFIPSRDTPLPSRGADPRAADAKTADAKTADAKTADARPPDAKTGDARPADAKSPDGRAAADARREPRVEGRIEPRAEPPRKDAKSGKGDEIQQLADSAQSRAKPPAAGGPVPVTQRYLLQVGAFATEAGARQAVDKVQSSGLTAFTEPIKTDRGQRVRVRVGPFPSREAAEQARERLKQAGIESALIAP
jgi:DedD protein